MTEKMKNFYKGDEITKIESMKKLRKPIIHLLGTYPIYDSFGIIEYYFEERDKNEVINILAKDRFIEVKPNTFPRLYRLTPKEIDLAISFINLESSKKIVSLTKWIIGLTFAMIIGLSVQISIAIMPFLIH